jgi:putative phosphoribosyl transferase
LLCGGGALAEKTVAQQTAPHRQLPVVIPAGGVSVSGDLTLPQDAPGVVVFAHGSGSGRFSPRNRAVAGALARAGLGTLLMDLLTEQEEAVDLRTRHLRFDIGLLGRRVVATVDWLASEPSTSQLPVGCFGASTGAAAALIAAAERPARVGAGGSRGGRPDLAGGDALRRVRAPTLLIVGGNDPEVLRLNEEALAALPGEARLEVLPGAGHLFEQPGELERVSLLARDWFLRHLRR